MASPAAFMEFSTPPRRKPLQRAESPACNGVPPQEQLDNWGEPIDFDADFEDDTNTQDHPPMSSATRALFPPAGGPVPSPEGTPLPLPLPLPLPEASVVSTTVTAPDQEVCPSYVLDGLRSFLPVKAAEGQIVAINVVYHIGSHTTLALQWCTLADDGPWPRFAEALLNCVSNRDWAPVQVKVRATFARDQCLQCARDGSGSHGCNRSPDTVLRLDGVPDFGHDEPVDIGMRHATRTLALAVCMADLGSVGLAPFRRVGQHLENVLALTPGPFIVTRTPVLYMTLTITIV